MSDFKGPFEVKTFGNDCLGNITGYRVQRSEWVPRPYSQRDDGLSYETEVRGQFIGNIHEGGSFDRAKAEAEARCAALNQAVAEGRL